MTCDLPWARVYGKWTDTARSAPNPENRGFGWHLSLGAPGQGTWTSAVHATCVYNGPVRFEWDEDKASSNRRKHGVSFEEGRTVFDDPLAAIFDDERHSLGEHREVIIGHSEQNRLLLVFFTERPQAVRIFSARPATRQEQKDYEEGLKLRSF